MDKCETRGCLTLTPEFESGARVEPAAEQVLDILRGCGFAHIRRGVTAEWFENLSARLGRVALRSDIVFDPAREAAQQHTRAARPNRPSAYQAAELGFHNDNPEWNLLGFYCVEQDPSAGSNLLLDGCDIPRHFRREELEQLCAVRLMIPTRNADGVERVEYAPVLTRASGGYGMYWAPWLLLDNYDEAQSALVERFRKWVQCKEQTELIEVRLLPGEILFVHNSRMLHGRRSLSEGSRRHLVRLAIECAHLGPGI